MIEDLHSIRRFYRAHLSKYAWARRLKGFIVRAWLTVRGYRQAIRWHSAVVAHSLRRKIFAILNPFSPALASAALKLLSAKTPRVQFFSMISFPEYCARVGRPAVTLVPGRKISLSMPIVHPEQYRNILHPNRCELEAPKVSAVELHNAEVVGKCDFVFVESRCVHHGMYRFDRDLAAEEMHGFVRIDAEGGLVARYRGTKEKTESVPAAISLVGSASANYAHWLTEHAAKLALVDELELYSDFPLIVDAGLHPNIIESIECLNSRRRPVILIGGQQVCRVERLVALTPTAYVPFDFRPGASANGPLVEPSSAVFASDAMKLLRHKAVSGLSGRGRKAAKRLFLRRTSTVRQILNAQDVEAQLLSLGFEIVEPESMTFSEQVSLLSQAEMVVSQAGAALGNLIFAPEGCHVLVISAWSPYSNYYYFSNLASMLGQRCTLVLCSPGQSSECHPAHKNMWVDIEALKEAMQL